MSPHMKYLGIMLDGEMKFNAHFKYALEKMDRVERALFRLMPNLRGPKEGRRRLYANVLASVALYGAPIWCDTLLKSRMSLRRFRASQRSMAKRVCSAYRTISYTAATLLARTPPLELLAIERKNVYRRILEAGGRIAILPEELNRIRLEGKRETATEWERQLRDDRAPGKRTLKLFFRISANGCPGGGVE